MTRSICATSFNDSVGTSPSTGLAQNRGSWGAVKRHQGIRFLLTCRRQLLERLLESPVIPGLLGQKPRHDAPAHPQLPIEPGKRRKRKKVRHPPPQLHVRKREPEDPGEIRLETDGGDLVNRGRRRLRHRSHHRVLKRSAYEYPCGCAPAGGQWIGQLQQRGLSQSRIVRRSRSSSSRAMNFQTCALEKVMLAASICPSADAPWPPPRLVPKVRKAGNWEAVLLNQLPGTRLGNPGGGKHLLPQDDERKVLGSDRGRVPASGHWRRR